MEKIFENLEKYILYAVVVLFAVFFLPQFPSAFVAPKEILLGVGALLVLLLWSIRMIIKGGTTFAIGKFDLGILLIAAAYITSSILKTPNKFEAYFVPGTVTFVVGSAIVYFLLNQLGRKAKQGATVALFISGVLLSLSILATQLGLFAKIPQLPAFVKDPSFNPMAGALTSAIYLIALLPICASLIVEQKDLIKKIFLSVSTVVVIFGLVITISSILPGKPQFPRFPSYQTSWAITVDTLKQSPMFGIGPSNYLSAFNIFKPVAYNQTDLWNGRFSTASNFYFTLVTEAGIVGFLALSILLVSIFNFFKREFKSLNSTDAMANVFGSFSILVLALIFAFFPISSTLIFLLFVLLAIYSRSENKVTTLNIIPSGDVNNVSLAAKIPSIITAVPIFAIVIFISYFGIKMAIAETTFKKSLDALAKNDAKTTYDLMAKAISQYPTVDRYHASLAQVDMALATSIASKKDITDADKQTVTQLVQQGINEGKATVTLNPQRSDNWQLLAEIYRNIMPFAQGADNFAVQTYTQAVGLDPVNPNLRISLGGVYYALGKYDDAIDAFKLAVVSKPDLPNAHYNLAIAYREKKDFDNAITEMNTVLTLVKKDSADYNLAKTTLEDLQKNKPAPAPAKTTETRGQDLTAPKPAETSNIKPPIDLPADSTPPTQ